MPDPDAVRHEAERQLSLLDRDIPKINLWDYDGGIMNASAGKDSLAMMIAVYRLALEQSYPLDRLVVQYNALGDRVTWPGTADIGPNAEPLVRAFGVRPGTGQLRLKAFLSRQWRQMPAAQFMAVFGPYSQRIDQILDRFDPTVVAHAAARVDDRDAEVPLRPEESTR